MEKKIETFLAYNDFEIREMCPKPGTFEGFAECATHVFFPIIEKHNYEKSEPVDLIPLGFLKNHTYYDVIYFPRAIEWKFIFDDGADRARQFEEDLATIVWYIGKSFAQKKNDDEPAESYPAAYEMVKKHLNKGYIYLPDHQINWLSQQNLFLEAFERIFEGFHFEEGFEQTKKWALKYAINPKFSKRMLNELKYMLNMVDEEQILDYVFKENEDNIVDVLNGLGQKAEYFLKVFFDLVNHENINELIKIGDITLEFYSLMVKYKTPEDMVEIMKVCPIFYSFIDIDSENDDLQGELIEILESDKSKSSFIENLVKYVQNGKDDHEIIYCYLDIINNTHSLQKFLIRVSRLTDLESAHFLLMSCKAYFEINPMTDETEEFDLGKSIAIYLNLYFNFNLSHEIAQIVFDIQNTKLGDLKSNLVKETGELNIDYVSDFIVNLKNEPQTEFIKSLGPRAQQHLKENFARVKEFSKRMRLASVIAKMQNS